MTNAITTPLRVLSDLTLLPFEEFESLYLRAIPKKMRIRVVTANGEPVQVRHISDRILLQLLTECDVPTADNIDEADARSSVAHATLRAAANLLDDKREGRRLYGTIGTQMIEIWIPDRCTGKEALAILEAARDQLLRQAASLIADFANGIEARPARDFASVSIGIEPA